MIIQEYAKVSIDRERSILNLLHVCPLWRAIIENCQHLYTPHMVLSGHDDVELLLELRKRKLIHTSIISLTINLALKYAEEPLGGASGHVPAMAQLQQDLDRLRSMFCDDWKPQYRMNDPPPHWESLNLEHFSLVVDLSAVSARKVLLKAWTRAWVSRLSRQWRGMGWTGSEGEHGAGYYSYWDR